MLLCGPPGTGKTLLAKAVAGKPMSPSLRLVDPILLKCLWESEPRVFATCLSKAKRMLHVLSFIDEIDAVGRSRFSGIGGGHDEREQTLNALLVEMDGFDTQEGIIIIAATNRPDVLDQALLRPGRFDRQ